MTAVRRYEGTVYDSNRWDGFELRPGDIIIGAPPKCGTTWTQMISALLIMQEPELPLPLDTLSPWIDMVTRARKEVFVERHRCVDRERELLPRWPAEASTAERRCRRWPPVRQRRRDAPSPAARRSPTR